MIAADSFAPSMRGWHLPAVASPRDGLLRRRVLDLGALPTGGTMLDARVPLLLNDEMSISCARPTREDDVWFSNGDGDEIVIVMQGQGRLESAFGSMSFGAADLLWIPRGLSIRWRIESDDSRLVFVEVRSRAGRVDAFLQRALPLASRVMRPIDPARIVASEVLLVIKRRDRFFERASKSPVLDPTNPDPESMPMVFTCGAPVRPVAFENTVACAIARSDCFLPNNPSRASVAGDEITVPLGASPSDDASGRLAFVPAGVPFDDANEAARQCESPTLALIAFAPLAMTPNAVAIDVA